MVNAIKPVSIDELRDTFIEIGCYRETWRLDRVLSVYQKALHLARSDGNDGHLVEGLKSLHDRKGVLSVIWNSQAAYHLLHRYVDAAWEDCNECDPVHVAPGMRLDGDYGVVDEAFVRAAEHQSNALLAEFYERRRN